MQKRNLLLAALFASLSACQTESVTPKPADQPIAQPTSAPPIEVSVKVNVAGQQGAPQVEQKATVAVPPNDVVAEAVKPAPATPKLPTVAPAKPVVAAGTKPAEVLGEADALALAKKSNCLACHMIGKKMVGPAWRDVAAKYRNDAAAENRLVEKVAKGGSGVWGSMAMPPSPQVSEMDRRKLIRFILSLK